MIPWILVAIASVAGEPSPEQRTLLKTFRDEFVLITPGEGKFPAEFTMGSDAGSAAERPARRVAMTKPFFIAKYEVPQNLWQAVMGDNPSRWKGPRNSVEMLSWDEANAFCRKATELMRSAGLIDQRQVVRLPIEAEWEYAARAGASTRYSFGDDVKMLDDYAWHTGNAAGNDPPVGAKKPNAWGLYDVHGYLWEWCADPWPANKQAAPDQAEAKNSDQAAQRVLRGGSWKDPAERLTSSYRQGAAAALRDDAVGLRCVLDNQ
jgi:formylglycine-generating enzyme required for sulfatase activity